MGVLRKTPFHGVHQISGQAAARPKSLQAYNLHTPKPFTYFSLTLQGLHNGKSKKADCFWSDECFRA
jgi:hypothetical protein